MAKRRELAGGIERSRRNFAEQDSALRRAAVEALEGRMLLAVTVGEYDTIRSTYGEFALPADMAQINIIEITPSQLSVANLKSAITTAGSTTLPELVVLRTTDTQNTITYGSTADAVSIDIPSAKGAISMVGFGSRPLTVDAANQSRVISIGSASSTTTVNLGGLTLTRGYLADHGEAGSGAGVKQFYGTLNLTNVAISGNTTADFGSGGGVYQDHGALTLTNVTISGNTADFHGGGVYQYYGTSALTNVTISGNTASCGGGGGVYLDSGTSTLTNVTISGDKASGGGGVYLSSGTLALRNTIVARSVAATGPDVYQYTGSTLSGSNNFIGDGSGQSSLVNGSNGNLVGSSTGPIDPKLAEGSSFGIGLSPLPDSPAIDAGDDSLIPLGISTDVYGAPRIQGARVNIGAVETVLPGVPGATYVVTSLADSTAADGVITLREALAAANSNQAVGDAPAGSYSSADVIRFAPGFSGTIRTNGQAYQISGSTSISGPGTGQLTLNGAGTSGVLDIRGVYDVSISGMTITGGNAVEGGGVYAAGSRLTLDQMVISGNTQSSGYGYGGGVCQCYGTLTLTNVTISGNTADLPGGGVYQYYSTSTLTNVTISGNTASPGGGGMRLDSSTSTLTNVTISGNMAWEQGGGVDLNSSTLILRNTIVARNAAGNGADVNANSGVVSGANNLIGDGSGQSSLVNGSNGNLVGSSTSPIDPKLAEGPGLGIALSPLPGSPVIDAGDNGLIPIGISTDVYGAPRIQGARVNIGAVETVLPGMPGVTYVVSSLGDGIAADGVVTLCEALAAANSNQAVGDAPAGSYSSADLIEFAPGLSGTIRTNGQAYQISGSVSITGPSVGQLTIHGGGASGVLDVRGVYDVSISGMTITGGNAGQGGGIYMAGSHLALNDMVISGNTASPSGHGGGVCLYGGTSMLRNVTISGNTASSGGGGLYSYYSTLTLTNVTISGNTALSDNGGGVYLDSGASTLANVTISGNRASNCGGGVYLDSGTSTLTNVTISGNTASGGGGAYLDSGTSMLTNVTISGNMAAYRGGGLSRGSGTSTLTNVTISGNMAWERGGGVDLSSGTLALRNTIVARNVAGTSPDVHQGSSGTLSGLNSLIGDGSGQTLLVNGSSGNLVGSSASPIDPMLAEGTSLGIGLSPLPGSPVIDAGDNGLIPIGISTDVYWAARIQGARVNMGAVETVLPGMPGVTYVVSSLGDSIAADGAITLREALAAANSNQAVGDAPAGSYSSADLVEFAPGLNGSIYTNGQAYQIGGSISIIGSGISQLTLNGGGTSGVLDIRGMYDVSIRGMTITRGKAGKGGGIYAFGSHLALNQMVISGNTALPGGYGAGVWLCGGIAMLTNVMISGNTGAYYGGGLHSYYNALTLTNVTISGNTASSHGGGLDLNSGTLRLQNTIVVRNASHTGPDVYSYGTGTLSGSDSLIGNGSGQSTLVNGSNGNLVGTSASPIDPQFVNMAGTDWRNWDLRLLATSPAVNAGNNDWIPTGVATDITGGARIDGGTVDMGAYELNQAPTVTAVYVRGSSWTSGYLSFLAANLAGSSASYGYAIPVGSGTAQLQTLPWRNLNQISLRFSEDVSIAQAQFAMVGSVGSYSVSGFSYSSADHVATWSLSAAIGPDKLYVAVPGSGSTPVRDAAGNVLDGEWVNPTSYSQVGSTDTFPSGNGIAVGDFAFHFDVLPGDSTGGSLGKVNVADALQIKSRSGLPVSTSTYRSDFDGNNLVNVADVLYVKSKSSIYSLPVNPPVLPVFGAVSSQVSLLLSRAYSLLGNA